MAPELTTYADHWQKVPVDLLPHAYRFTLLPILPAMVIFLLTFLSRNSFH